jgi:hypothetical protein
MARVVLSLVACLSAVAAAHAGDKEVEAAVSLVQSKKAADRLKGLEAIGGMGGDGVGATVAVCRLLANDPGPKVTAAAMDALSKSDPWAYTFAKAFVADPVRCDYSKLVAEEGRDAGSVLPLVIASATLAARTGPVGTGRPGVFTTGYPHKKELLAALKVLHRVAPKDPLVEKAILDGLRFPEAAVRDHSIEVYVQAGPPRSALPALVKLSAADRGKTEKYVELIVKARGDESDKAADAHLYEARNVSAAARDAVNKLGIQPPAKK